MKKVNFVIDKTALGKELDFLMAFWADCSCEKCRNMIKMPTERFPEIFKLLAWMVEY